MKQKETAQLLEQFLDPSESFRPAVMWFWNDVLDLEEITAQLREFQRAGMIDFFVHPLSGAEYAYLSEEFFDAVRHTVKVAKELGLRFWIYDEYNWPSGIAGGQVIRDHPEYRAKTLNCRKITVKAGVSVDGIFFDGSFLRADSVCGDGAFAVRRDISDSVQITSCGDGFLFRYVNRSVVPVTVYVYSVALQNYLTSASRLSRFALYQHGYIDPLNPRAIRAFLDSTHEKYKKAVGEEFGKTVKGVFTDEICVGYSMDLGKGRIPWTDGLERLYRERYGQDLLPWLYALTDVPVTPEEKQVRYRYWQLVTERMNTCHVRQVAEWCKKEGLEYTGHFYGEESAVWWLYQSGDIFTQLKELSIPGMDSIFSVPRIEDENFNLAAKLLASCGRFYQKDRLLCETFSGSGYSLRFPQMRRVVNRLMTLGINMIQYMGAYFSLDNGRKQTPVGYRAHFGGSNPLFRHLDRFGDYVARVQAVSAATKPCGRVLLVCPMAGVSAAVDGHSALFETYYYRHDKYREGFLDRTLIGVAEALLRMNVEYDLCSDGMAGDIVCSEGRGSLYGNEYDLILFLETENTTSRLLAVAENLCRENVRTVWINSLPSVTVDDGKEIVFPKYPNSVYIKQDFTTDSLADPRWEVLLSSVVDRSFRTLNIRHEGGIYTGLRRLGDTDVVFLSNDTDREVSASLTCPEGTLFLDPETGKPFPVSRDGEEVCLCFSPYCMIVAIVGDNIPYRFEKPASEKDFVLLDGKEILLPEGNILPVRWELISPEGEVLCSARKGNALPGVHCLSGERKLLRFSFEAQELPEDLVLCMETAWLHSCSMNGHPVEHLLRKDRFWGVNNCSVSVTPYLKTGNNILVVEISVPENYAPFSLPYAFFRGTFATDGRGLLPLNDETAPQGCKYLFGDKVCRFTKTLTKAQSERFSRLSAESMDVLSLSVNGIFVDRKLWSPFLFDLTGVLREGENVFELTVTQPLHNVFCAEEECIETGLIGVPILF